MFDLNSFKWMNKFVVGYSGVAVLYSACVCRSVCLCVYVYLLELYVSCVVYSVAELFTLFSCMKFSSSIPQKYRQNPLRTLMECSSGRLS